MKKVVLYVTSDSPYCLKTKELLDRNHVSYSEIDVGKDEFAWKEMVRKSGQMGVPVIEIDGNILIGYDENTLREILKMSA